MKRLSEGWWLMIVVCVASGLWFLVMPLLGYGYTIDGIALRPGWMGVPPCLFGAVYAARSTRFEWLTGLLAGATLFGVTLLSGVQFFVMEVTHIPGCALWGERASCKAIEYLDEKGDQWDPAVEMTKLKDPSDPSTFIERLY